MKLLGNLDCEARWAGVELPEAVQRRISLYAALFAACATDHVPGGDERHEVWIPARIDPTRLLAYPGWTPPVIRVVGADSMAQVPGGARAPGARRSASATSGTASSSLPTASGRASSAPGARLEATVTCSGTANPGRESTGRESTGRESTGRESTEASLGVTIIDPARESAVINPGGHSTAIINLGRDSTNPSGEATGGDATTGGDSISGATITNPGGDATNPGGDATITNPRGNPTSGVTVTNLGGDAIITNPGGDATTGTTTTNPSGDATTGEDSTSGAAITNPGGAIAITTGGNPTSGATITNRGGDATGGDATITNPGGDAIGGDAITDIGFNLAWADPAAAAANDRSGTLAIARELGVALPGARVVGSLAELDEQLARFAGRRWICKARWTAAGRDRARGVGPATGELRTRIGRMLARLGPLVFEPWLDRVADFGVCGEIAASGEVRVLEPHRLITDPRGGFLGIELWPRIDRAVAASLCGVAHAAASLVAARTGYRGRFAIDAFVYREGDAHRLHPLCEFNARHSFGWIARALARRMGIRRLGFDAPPHGAMVLIAPGADGVTAWCA